MKRGKEVKTADAKPTPIMMSIREPTIKIRRILVVVVEAAKRKLKIMPRVPINKITKDKIIRLMKDAANNNPSFIKNSANRRIITKTIIVKQVVNSAKKKILTREMMIDKHDRQIKRTKINSIKSRTKSKMKIQRVASKMIKLTLHKMQKLLSIQIMTIQLSKTMTLKIMKR